MTVKFARHHGESAAGIGNEDFGDVFGEVRDSLAVLSDNDGGSTLNGGSSELVSVAGNA